MPSGGLEIESQSAEVNFAFMPGLRAHFLYGPTQKNTSAFSNPASTADSTVSYHSVLSHLPKYILAVSSQEVMQMVSMCPFLLPFFHVLNLQCYSTLLL